jgi:hypothetical protein
MPKAPASKSRPGKWSYCSPFVLYGEWPL